LIKRSDLFDYIDNPIIAKVEIKRHKNNLKDPAVVRIFTYYHKSKMGNNIKPKLENADKGYSYTVTQEQIDAYKKWSLKEKLQWIWDTNVLLSKVQTPEERAHILRIKHKTNS
jgi:hypothetical protein